MESRRALHYVFKIGNREKNINFFKNILGMKVLRHEEFEAGCKATCNGPYDGKWSKTMIGYGPEDNHFVCELTYNYGISHYEKGNDMIGLFIQSSEILQRAKNHRIEMKDGGDNILIKSPDDYHFYITDKPQPADRDPVVKVGLSVNDLGKSLDFWSKILNLKILNENSKSALLAYASNQASLLLEKIDVPINRAKAFGRIAFACPSSELRILEDSVKMSGHTILTPYVSLDTPGKATVEVVILADPDGHEICFVGDEGFRDLSKVDFASDDLLTKAICEDKSDDWFARKGGKNAA